MPRQEELDYRGYPTRPRKLSGVSWYYEQPEGIVLVVNGTDVVSQNIIPWRKLEAAVDHHRKVKSARKRTTSK